MSFCLKLLPEVYTGIKTGSKLFVRKTNSILGPLKAETLRYKTLAQLQNEIKAAYQEYSRSPYVNNYLREGRELSPQAQQQVWALKAAINTAPPVTGKFVRGLMPTRKQALTPEVVENFIFENKGFTSTVPIENASFASCFSVGKGATVTFDISKPMPAYKASSYEVLFDTNAFTRDKFKIIHEGENNYRVVQR